MTLDRALLARLCRLQARSGAFLCSVTSPGGVEWDYNAFTTALVLRGMRSAAGRLGTDPRWEGLRQRALDFLESCASARLSGAFGFWPAGSRPAWARRVPDDLDDTAVCNVELYMGGRRTLAQLQDVVYDVLMPSLLVRADPHRPPWIRPLVFVTWLGSAERDNVVDCCANANALALMSLCELRHLPGYAQASAMICDALDWVCRVGEADARLRLRCVTPYYPDPAFFHEAVQHAVECGVGSLQPCVTLLDDLRRRLAPTQSESGGVCSNAYGGPVWHCPALQVVAIAASAGRRPGLGTPRPAPARPAPFGTQTRSRNGGNGYDTAQDPVV